MSTSRFEQNASFVWEIKGIGNVSRLLALESPDFFVEEAAYRLKLGYGYTPCDGKCLQIRLERVSGELKKWYVCLDVARENLKKGYKPFKNFPPRSFDKGVACVFLVPDSDWSKADEELLPDGSVKIICSLDNLDVTFQDADKRKGWFGTTSSTDFFSRDFRKLLLSGRGSDMVLKCGKRTMYAHALVLFARSRVLENMLMDCEDSFLELDEADEPVFAHLLSYVYSGDIGDATRVCLSRLCEAAARYGLHDLKNKCFLAMRAKLGKDNVYEYLVVWDALNNFDFKTAAVNYLVETEEMLESEEWKQFFQKNSRLGNEILKAVLEKKSKRIRFLNKINEIQRNR